VTEPKPHQKKTGKPESPKEKCETGAGIDSGKSESGDNCCDTHAKNGDRDAEAEGEQQDQVQVLRSRTISNNSGETEEMEDESIEGIPGIENHHDEEEEVKSPEGEQLARPISSLGSTASSGESSAATGDGESSCKSPDDPATPTFSHSSFNTNASNSTNSATAMNLANKRPRIDFLSPTQLPGTSPGTAVGGGLALQHSPGVPQSTATNCGVMLSSDIMICGVCRSVFTVISDFLSHKRHSHCRLRFVCRCFDTGASFPAGGTTTTSNHTEYGTGSGGGTANSSDTT